MFNISNSDSTPKSSAIHVLVIAYQVACTNWINSRQTTQANSGGRGGGGGGSGGSGGGQ